MMGVKLETESQWTTNSACDINLHASDFEDRHLGISFINSEMIFSVDFDINDLCEFRDELSRYITDIFRADDSIRCPACGYSWEDATTHGDHRNCRRFPFFPDESGSSYAQ